MYMTLDDLRTKFENDQNFAVQFVTDFKEIYPQEADWAKVDILDASGAIVDKTKLYGNNDLLNTYVQFVTALNNTANLNAHAKNRLPSYLHAPFNEPIFEINTNTRVISVPSEFQKNGIGIVGDHLAEIIFFKLPRFYDVNDLYDSTSITIYWYNNGEKELPTYYKTAPTIKYTEGDILVLGWAISEAATAVAGTIEFSIEFEHKKTVDENTQVVDFRLETQSAKLIVKSTLELDKDNAVSVDHYNDITMSRAIYSNVINSLTTAPARIIENLPGDNNSHLVLDNSGHLDFDPETNNITFHIAAVSPDNNELIYNWSWNGIIANQPSGSLINSSDLIDAVTYELKDPKNIVFADPVLIAESGSNYSAVSDVMLQRAIVANASPVDNEWYERVGNSYELTEDTEVDSEKVYYVLGEDNTTYQTLTTNVPGVYEVYVGNKDNNGSIRYVYSNIINIESASNITINNTPLPGNKYIKTLSLPQGTHNINNFTYGDGDSITVGVEGANGNITYVWHKFDATTGAEIVDDEHLIQHNTNYPTNSALNVATVYDSSDDMRGIYQCEAINTKNNTVTHAFSSKIMVELLPKKIPEEDRTNLTLVQNSTYNFTVTFSNAPYDGAEYAMYAVISPQAVGTENKQIYVSEPNTVNYFRAEKVGNKYVASRSFDIAKNLTGIDNTEYDLDVWVVPITERGTEFEKMPKNENGVPDYTRVQIAGLVYHVES